MKEMTMETGVPEVTIPEGLAIDDRTGVVSLLLADGGVISAKPPRFGRLRQLDEHVELVITPIYEKHRPVGTDATSQALAAVAMRGVVERMVERIEPYLGGGELPEDVRAAISEELPAIKTLLDNPAPDPEQKRDAWVGAEALYEWWKLLFDGVEGFPPMDEFEPALLNIETGVSVITAVNLQVMLRPMRARGVFSPRAAQVRTASPADD